MAFYVFLENWIAMLLIVPFGAAIMCALAFLVMPWREVLKTFAGFCVLFWIIGTLAVLPSLLTGERHGQASRDCPGAIYGYSCY